MNVWAIKLLPAEMITFKMQLAPHIVCQRVIQRCNPPDCASAKHLIQWFTWFAKRNRLSPCSDWGADVWTVFWTVSLNIQPLPTWVLLFCFIAFVANYQNNPVAVKTALIHCSYQAADTSEHLGNINLTNACPLLAVPCQCCWSVSPEIPAGTLWWYEASGWQWGAPALRQPSGYSALTSLDKQGWKPYSRCYS